MSTPSCTRLLNCCRFAAGPNQLERRNLTGQELHAAVAKYVQLQDRVRAVVRNGNGQFTGAPIGAPGNGKSATETADVLGVSARTIERARALLATDDEEDLPAPRPQFGFPSA